MPREKPSLTRSDTIDALVKALVQVDYVEAFWERGAAAWSRVDEWSDIDAYLLVEEGGVSEAFEVVERVLTSLSPLKQKYVISKNHWPGISQAFYSLERANEFLVLDLAILTRSSPTKFLEPEIHGTSIFHINNQAIDQKPPVDMKSFEKKATDDMEAMRQRFQMFSNFVEKEVRRGNSLEALEYYRTIIIPSLVEALRAKLSPMHYDFRMRYIHYELPTDVIEKLEDLCFVSDLRDLETKCVQAIRWFNELAAGNHRHDEKFATRLSKP